MDTEFDQRDQRREYQAAALSRGSLAADPLAQFAAWLEEAAASGIKDPTAMALATVGTAGEPSLRTVLLKHFDADGFCWYTDYRSRKGRELAGNPNAALLFHWREWDRQVRISGTVERLPAAQSDAYFQSRPAESRFAAAASVQSAPVPDRKTLEQALAALRRRHPNDAPPRPPQWGGYRLRPDAYEFWQGREGRLHDRFAFRRNGPDGWTVTRLQP